MLINKVIPTLLVFAFAIGLPVIYNDESHVMRESVDAANHSQSENSTGLYIQTFIDDNEVSRDDVLRWEARRIQVVKKRLQEGLMSLLKQEAMNFLFSPEVSIDNIVAEREALVQTKIGMSHDERIKLVSSETAIAGAVTLFLLKALSGFTSSSIHMKSNRGTAEGFRKWYLSKISDEKVMLQACPDHYALGTAFNLGQDVVETTGGSVLPSHFAINYEAQSDLPIVDVENYPVQFNGPAYGHGTETVIGGTNHVMRSLPNNGGFEIVPKVFFPSSVPTYHLEQHRWHLATEWGNWITAYINDKVDNE